MRRIARHVDAGDLVAGLGLLCLGGGLGMLSVPAALIVVGALLLAIAVLPRVARKG